MIFPLIALLGLGLLMSRSRSRASSASSTKASSSSQPNPGDIAKRIVTETQEILDGKRDAYTDSDEAAAELERARKAVELARQKEAQAPKPAPSAAAPTPKPTPTVSVGPVQAKPTPKAPAGTDLALAKQTAAKVAAHLKTAGRDRYDRKVLKLWQTRAGIAADGIYGRGSASALKYFTPAAPAPFFAQGVASYTPPAA